MSLYPLILWNQVNILQKHLKKDHVHMRLWTRFYGMLSLHNANIEPLKFVTKFFGIKIKNHMQKKVN